MATNGSFLDSSNVRGKSHIGWSKLRGMIGPCIALGGTRKKQLARASWLCKNCVGKALEDS